MSNTIQTSPEYISATTTLQSLLFPTKVSKSSNKATTLAERIEAIPTKTSLLVTRNTRDGLEKLLNKELGHFVTVRKTEEQVVDKMATFLVASSADIRDKRVIANTPLSTQISTLNNLMAKAKTYLNTTAFEFEKMNKKTGLFASWIPDRSCSYFATALAKYLEAHVQPTTTADSTRALTHTSSTEVNMRTGGSTDSLTQDSESTTTQNSNNSPSKSDDSEEWSQVSDGQKPVQRLRGSTETLDPTLSTTASSEEFEERTELSPKNLIAADNESSATQADDSTHTESVALVLTLPNEQEDTRASSIERAPNSEEFAETPSLSDTSANKTCKDQGRLQEILTAEQRTPSARNESVSPKDESGSTVITTSSKSDESINPETLPTALPPQSTQQPNKLQLPKVASSPQIDTQNVETTKVDKPTTKQMPKQMRVKSQELPSSSQKESPKDKEAVTPIEMPDPKKNLTGTTIHRRASATGKKGAIQASLLLE